MVCFPSSRLNHERLLSILIFFSAIATFAQTQKPYRASTFRTHGPPTIPLNRSAARPRRFLDLVQQRKSLFAQVGFGFDCNRRAGPNMCRGSSNQALAFSNGSTWSCFGTGTGTVNQAVVFTNAVTVSTTALAANVALVWSCWDSNNPANAIYPSNVSLNTSTYAMIFSFAVPQSGFCVINGSSGGGGGGGGGGSQASPVGSVQVNQGGGLFGAASLTLTASTPCSPYSGTCDLYSLPTYNSCIEAIYAADAAITYGNAYYLCNVAADSNSGGVTGSISLSIVRRNPRR